MLKEKLERLGYIKPIIYGAKILMNNPIYFFKDLKDDLIKDITWKKKYIKSQRLICFGLPKSGSTMIEHIYRELGYVDIFNTLIRRYSSLPKKQHVHEIHEGYFKFLPKDKGSFLKTHSHYNEELLNILTKHDVNAFILIRDIRDMMLSRYYHIINDPNHSEHKQISNMKFNEGFMLSLLTIKSGDKFNQLKYFNNWISDWVKLKRFPIIKYEDYILDKNLFIEKLLEISGFHKQNDIDIKSIINKIENTKNFKGTMKSKIKSFGKKKTTFRKGITGEWKSMFTKKHKDLFKEVAQESLELGGYEGTINW